MVIACNHLILLSAHRSSVNATNRLDLQACFNSDSTLSIIFGKTSRHIDIRDGTTNVGWTVNIACENSGRSTIENGKIRAIMRSLITIFDNAICWGLLRVHFVPRGLIIAFWIDGCFNYLEGVRMRVRVRFTSISLIIGNSYYRYRYFLSSIFLLSIIFSFDIFTCDLIRGSRYIKSNTFSSFK